MNYEEALNYIHGTLKFGRKLGLHNIGFLLDLMGNPHKKLKYVHVAGTNGKGSTSAFISSILTESGLNVGLYTSPYLERFTERIRINNAEIKEDVLAGITTFVKEKVDQMIQMGKNHPTEFEIVTAIAFQYYFENNCDIVVLEVGMGGRLDSTNIIDESLVSVITTISHDHMEWLGNTLSEIAREKAGIIKQGGDVLLYPQNEEVDEVFRSLCMNRDAKLHNVNMENLKLIENNIDGQKFEYDDLKGLRIKLLGRHQLKNAAVAISCVRLLREMGFDISDDDIAKGLLNTKWPGRLEVLSKNPDVIIDVGHNGECAGILKEAIEEYFPGKDTTIVIGVMKDKDYESMVKKILPIASRFIAVTPESERSLPAKELAIFIKPYCKYVYTSDTIEEAVKSALELTPQNGIICAFGSFVHIGTIRKLFINREN